MNFTREPIIETVITPREGCKLVVRSSKGNGQEDYFVDAVEVVSFGHSFFFRSQERPKSFLVPVSDYEILELKETRMVLKNVSTERAIKIGGGREMAPPRAPREEAPQDIALSESRPAPTQEQRPPMGGKRDKRRRGRRGRDRHDHPPQDTQRSESYSSGPSEREQQSHQEEDFSREESHKPPEDHLPTDSQAFSESERAPEKAPSFISKLFPPPPTLIKDTLSRYKPAESSDAFPPETIFEHPTDKELEDESEE